jgi:hypothetical protein
MEDDIFCNLVIVICFKSIASHPVANVLTIEATGRPIGERITTLNPLVFI